MIFGDVNDTGDQKVLPVLACLHLKMKNKQNSIFRCKVHSTKIFTKNEQIFYLKFFYFIAVVVDTADKHSFAIILHEFLKKFETIPMAYSGARRTLIYEKT